MPDRYTRFGKAYRRLRDLQTQDVCGHSIQYIRNDALGQMLFVTTVLHERAGTNPRYARFHQEAIQAALATGSLDFDHRVVEDGGFRDAVWREFETRCPGGKTNRSHTYGPVAGTLRLLHERQRANWCEVLGTVSPAQAWDMLDELDGVGPKLSSFMLREFQAFFAVWTQVPQDSWYCFVPVDRWVLRVVKLLWRNNDWPEEPPMDVKAYRSLAQGVAEKFPSLDAAMEFNMGSWFLNAMRYQVLAVHGNIVIGEMPDEALHNVAANLDVERVRTALANGIAVP